MDRIAVGQQTEAQLLIPVAPRHKTRLSRRAPCAPSAKGVPTGSTPEPNPSMPEPSSAVRADLEARMGPGYVGSLAIGFGRDMHNPLGPDIVVQASSVFPYVHTSAFLSHALPGTFAQASVDVAPTDGRFGGFVDQRWQVFGVSILRSLDRDPRSRDAFRFLRKHLPQPGPSCPAGVPSSTAAIGAFPPGLYEASRTRRVAPASSGRSIWWAALRPRVHVVILPKFVVVHRVVLCQLASKPTLCSMQQSVLGRLRGGREALARVN